MDSVERDALWAQVAAKSDEFASWSAGVQDGTIRLGGIELGAYREGFWAGRQRSSPESQAASTEDFTARQRVAYALGYAEGLLLPQVAQDARQPSGAADLIREHRSR